MRTRLVAALLTGLALAAGTACGSSDDPAAAPTAAVTTTTATAAVTTTTAATTKAEFLAAGNAICKDLNDRSAAVTAALPGGKPTTTEDYVVLFTENANLIESSLEQLKALPQPPGDEAVLAAMYADVEALVDVGRRAAAAYRSGDAAAMKAVAAEGNDLQAKSNASANAYGLTECGKGG